MKFVERLSLLGLFLGVCGRCGAYPFWPAFVRDGASILRVRSVDGVACTFSVDAYKRSAQRAFDGCGQVMRRGSAAYRFFGKQSFYGQDAFVNSTVDPKVNPWQGFSLLSPRLKISEHGAVGSIDVSYSKPESCFSYGARLFLPYRSRHVRVLKACGSRCENGSSLLGGLCASDVFKGNQTRYAYRLDALARFPMIPNNATVTPFFVIFRDTGHAASVPNYPITIANQDCTDYNGNPVVVVRVPVCTAPVEPYGVAADQVTQLAALAGGGLSGTDYERQRFVVANDYTSLGQSTRLNQFWIESTIDTDGQALPVARVIRTALNDLIGSLGPSAETLFERAGQSFASVERHGFGDTELHMYGEYEFCPGVAAQARLFVTVPTATRVVPCCVFDTSLGTNGHPEVGFGVDALLDDGWVRARAGLELAHDCKVADCVAAPFAGASIFGLGPMTKAQTSWNRGKGSGELLFCTQTERLFQELFAAVQYEYNVYGQPKIRLCTTQATDATGATQPLDARGLSEYLAWTSQGIGLALGCNGTNMQAFFGVQHAFAGVRSLCYTTWFCSGSLVF